MNWNDWVRMRYSPEVTGIFTFGAARRIHCSGVRLLRVYRELKEKNRELLRGGMSTGDRPTGAKKQPKASQTKKRARR